MTVLLDRVKLTAREMIATVTSATPVWAPSKLPRVVGDASIVSCKIVRGPWVRHAQAGYAEEPTALRWTVTDVEVGQRLILGLTAGRWHYDVEAGDDDTAARDGLLAAIAVGDVDGHETLPGVTVTPEAPSSFLLEAATPGLLWGAGVRGGTSEIEVVTAVDCESTTGTAECVLEFQAFARGAGINAHALLGALGGALISYDVKAIRERYGVAFRGPMTEPINLDALAGADWESRAAARLPVALPSYRAVAVSTIDTATTTVNVEGITLEFEVTP